MGSLQDYISIINKIGILIVYLTNYHYYKLKESILYINIKTDHLIK
jgi:hypothetical protein